MLDTIRVLQLGTKDWNKSYTLPEYVDLTYAEVLESVPKTPYDLVFVDRSLTKEEVLLLSKATKAYTLFVTEQVELNKDIQLYYASKKGKRIAEADIQDFLLHEARNYFPKPYGEKFGNGGIAIAQGFSGSVAWNGNYSLNLEGEYGEELNQIAFWRNNIPIFEGQAIDFWLEYQKDSGVEIALMVTQFVRGTVSEVQQKWFFTEKELDDVVTVDNQLTTGQVFVSLFAKGRGKLQIIALHDRYSRRGHGYFLPGGERYAASNREEIFYYFDPGDMKPPLNVYFSGYKTLQGFEGYYMMRSLGCPYLLIAEQRLEGGCVYMGSEEYEKELADIIRRHMEELGFTRDQVILSGISMGTCGAMHYGSDILPHAIILGKPIANVGDVAVNERLHRPGGFPSSLDMLNYLTGDADEASVEKLNDRFWDKFDTANWGKTKFVVAYMIEDDYDRTAYQKLISHVNAEGVQVYGKGIHGRHNDATRTVIGWFKSQYKEILHKDFSRRVE